MLLSPTRQRGYNNTPGDLMIFFELVEKIKRQYPIETEKIYLAGNSSGGLIARWLLVNHPSFWKAVVLISAPSRESWTSKIGTPSVNFPPVLFVHGDKDDQFPIEEVIRHVEILKSKGISASLLHYPDVGHEQKMEWSKEIFGWIQRIGDRR